MVTADNMKRRVACIEKFFDDVLDRNAKAPHLPPMGYVEAEELARLTMERMGVPPVVGVVATTARCSTQELARTRVMRSTGKEGGNGRRREEPGIRRLGAGWVGQ